MDSAATDEAEQALGDLRIYLSSGHLEAAMELLFDERALFAAHPTSLAVALNLLTDPVAHRVVDGQHTGMAEVLDRLFSLTATHDSRFESLSDDTLRSYRRALLSSRTPPHPLPRALRHAKLQELFRTTATIEGGVAECGCARGLSFLQLCYLRAIEQPAWQGKAFYVFDSFEGLSTPGTCDVDFSGMERAEAARVSSMTRAGKFSFDFSDVSARIWAEFPEVLIFKGWIPDRFPEIAGERFRFVHVDVDLYEPTLASFEFFYPRLHPGGVIVTDDYNWPGGRRAVDTFCQAHGLTPSLTDFNQAYLIAGAT